MNSTFAFVVAVLVSAGVAFGIVMFNQAEPRGPEPRVAGETQDVDARAEIQALKQRIEQLEAAATVVAVPRMEVAEDIDARIETAVARALVAASSNVMDAGVGDFNVDAVVVELLDGVVNPHVSPEIWARIKQAGKTEEVVAAFKRRAEENPNDADAQAEYGEALLSQLMEADNQVEQGRFAFMADAAWTKALEVDSNHWNARFNKAVSYTFYPAFTGKPAEAVTHFETLMTQQEARPSPGHNGYVETYVMLGNMLQTQGKADEAREVFARGLRHHPGDQRLRDKLK